jgi:hypothetical protein
MVSNTMAFSSFWIAAKYLGEYTGNTVSHYRKMSKIFTHNIASDSAIFILAGALAIAM